MYLSFQPISMAARSTHKRNIGSPPLHFLTTVSSKTTFLICCSKQNSPERRSRFGIVYEKIPHSYSKSLERRYNPRMVVPSIAPYDRCSQESSLDRWGPKSLSLLYIYESLYYSLFPKRTKLKQGNNGKRVIVRGALNARRLNFRHISLQKQFQF